MQEAAKYKVRPRPASTGGVVGERGHQDGFGLLLCGICVLQSLEKTGRVQMRGESMLISIDIFGFFEGREVLCPPFWRELPALLLHLNAIPAPIHGKNLFHAAIRKLECASCAEPFLEPKSYRLPLSLAFYRLLYRYFFLSLQKKFRKLNNRT